MLFALLVGLACLGSPARGDEANAAALKAQGDEAMRALRYGDALSAYELSYAREPNPAVLYNRARAQQALGHFPEALADFDRFSRDAPPDLRAKVPKLDALIAEVRARVAHVTVRSNATGARVILGDKVLGITPLGERAVLAGHGTLEVSADGYVTYRRDVDLPGGGALVIDATLVQKQVLAPIAPSPVQAASSTPGITSKWWFWAGVGVVVVGGIAVGAALLIERPAATGDYNPGRVSAPLVRF